MTRATTVLSLIAVAMLVVSCASSQQSDTTKVVVPPLEILKIPEGVHAKTTFFSKLVLNMPPGSKYGTHGLGGFCLDKQPLIWGDQAIVFAEDDIRTVFNAAMKKGQYPVYGRTDVLFEDPSQTDLIAAGLVKQANVDICKNTDVLGNLFLPMGGSKASVTGKATITVEWQILSRREGKVVYQTATKGILSEEMQKTTLRQILIGAFANAVDRLIADKGFFELVTTPQGQTKS